MQQTAEMSKDIGHSVSGEVQPAGFTNRRYHQHPLPEGSAQGQMGTTGIAAPTLWVRSTAARSIRHNNT